MKEKIILAEDEEILAEAVETILKLNGYEVIVVYNGLDLLNKIKKDTFSMIISDIDMPKMNGIEVVKEIRKLGIDIPILLISAKAEMEYKLKGMNAGANDYLPKPFKKEELLFKIKKLTKQN